MLNEQTNAILFFMLGLLLVLVNKRFAELCRAWDMRAFGRDLGIRSFRFPIVLIGTVLLLIGIGLLLLS